MAKTPPSRSYRLFSGAVCLVCACALSAANTPTGPAASVRPATTLAKSPIRCAKSQYVGGMIGGIGMAIHELTMTDRATGPILGDTLANYLIPVHADIPEFDIAMIDEDDPHLPGSVKGFGMLGTAGIQAAIANAVFRQSGRECGACRSGLKI